MKTSREIIICEYENKIIGVAIIKNSKEEKKFCTLKIAECAKGTGVAYELVVLALGILGEDKPFCSVRCEKEQEFSKLFKHFGFRKEAEQFGESFWNGE